MRSVSASPYLGNALWVLASSLQAALLLTLFIRKLYKSCPALCAYLVLNLVSSLVIVLFVYPLVGFNSLAAFRIGWASQGIVVAARAVAVGEFCYNVMGKFQGIWALGWRLLSAIAVVVLLAGIGLGRHDLRLLILTTDLGFELAIAATVVGLFVFAKYYDFRISDPLRSLGIGFCLYSCVYVLNDAFLQKFLAHYRDLWNHVGSVAFIASLAIWLRAYLKPVELPKPRVEMLDKDVYGTLMPEVNRRLQQLNDELGRVWKTETRFQ